MIVSSWWICRQKGFLGTSKVSSTYEVLVSIKDARWALLAPVVILGGIYSGIFTPTEASVVAVNYALFIGIFIYKELDLSKRHPLLNTRTRSKEEQKLVCLFYVVQNKTYQ